MVLAYPALPVTAFVSSALLALVLLTSAVRRSWNLGVTALCFCVLIENFMGGIELIVWRDNADIKLYTFCDFVSRWQVFTSIVKPASVLVITRNLHKIACMQGLFQSKARRRFELWFHLTMLVFFPAIVAGPLYYVVQANRFAVVEGYGCTNATDNSLSSAVILSLWRVVFPLYSIVVYCPRIFWTFFKHNRAMNHFLATDGAGVSRSRYLRVLAIASLDIVITLPPGIISFVYLSAGTLRAARENGTSPWYPGWDYVHEYWDPVSISLEAASKDKLQLFNINYGAWTSVLLPFIIFALFGLTKTARAAYWHALCSVAGVFGWDLALSVKQRKQSSTLLPMSFGRRTRATQASKLGTQLSVFVDVASALRRDARDSLDDDRHIVPRSAGDDVEFAPSSLKSSDLTCKATRDSLSSGHGTRRSSTSSVDSISICFADPVEVPPPVYFSSPR